MPLASVIAVASVIAEEWACGPIRANEMEENFPWNFWERNSFFSAILYSQGDVRSGLPTLYYKGHWKPTWKRQCKERWKVCSDDIIWFHIKLCQKLEQFLAFSTVRADEASFCLGQFGLDFLSLFTHGWQIWKCLFWRGKHPGGTQLHSKYLKDVG